MSGCSIRNAEPMSMSLSLLFCCYWCVVVAVVNVVVIVVFCCRCYVLLLVLLYSLCQRNCSIAISMSLLVLFVVYVVDAICAVVLLLALWTGVCIAAVAIIAAAELF